ncbi:hypothetical protein Enr8_26410 [Blastopirellula retiformator]|uniref:Phosphate-selective porin O and P n=2 Tax=Blastopirellula retiformator TaxID=2527970 RepID=A0A5C5V529_9BACT|nr:hypothetical protein Enr8_26410 [Blastopirellula retiformator]
MRAWIRGMVCAAVIACRLWAGQATAVAQVELESNASLQVIDNDLSADIEVLYRRIAELEAKVAQSQEALFPAEPTEFLPCPSPEPQGCFFSKCVGYDNGFYVRTCDQDFTLKVNGLLQVRQYSDWRNVTTGDDFEAGFVVERAPIIFSGNVLSPKLKYWFILQASRASGTNFLEEGKIIYAFDNGMVFQAGRFRDPAFLREMEVSYTRQLPVERSYYNAVFSSGVIEGISLSKQYDCFRWMTTLNDGANSGSVSNSKDFYQDYTDIACSAGVDFKLFGEWVQYGDFTSWPDEEPAMFLRSSLFWQNEEHADALPLSERASYISYSGEMTYESHGFAAFGSLVGRHSQHDGPDINQYGGLGQISYQVIPNHWEPFVRYEHIWYDGYADISATGTPLNDSTLDIVSVGFNWYFHRQAFKFTIEAMHALDEVPVSVPNTGFLQDEAGQSGQTVLRSQIQLFF